MKQVERKKPAAPAGANDLTRFEKYSIELLAKAEEGAGHAAGGTSKGRTAGPRTSRHPGWRGTAVDLGE